MSRGMPSAAASASGRADRLRFDLPPALEAAEPPEARGLTRDAVRMLVARRSTGELVHSDVRSPAGVPRSRRPRGGQHVGARSRRRSMPSPPTALTSSCTSRPASTAARWVVEPRRPDGTHDRPLARARSPDHLVLPPDGRLEFLEPYLGGCRLWVADARLPEPVLTWLDRPRPPDPLRLRRASVACSPPTRTCTPTSPAARRCRAPAGRSPPTSSRASSPRASAWCRSCSTPASPRWKPTSCRTPSASGCRWRRPSR